jgi:hypothetical protein
VKGVERAAVVAARSQPRRLLRQHPQRRRHQHRLRRPRCRRHQQHPRHLHRRQQQGQGCQRAFKVAFSNLVLGIAPRMAMVAPTTLSALQTRILQQGSLRQRCVKGVERAAATAVAHSQPRRLQRRRHQQQEEQRHQHQWRPRPVWTITGTGATHLLLPLQHQLQRRVAEQDCRRAQTAVFSQLVSAIAPRMVMVAPTTPSAAQTLIRRRARWRQRSVQNVGNALIQDDDDESRGLASTLLRQRRRR